VVVLFFETQCRMTRYWCLCLMMISPDQMIPSTLTTNMVCDECVAKKEKIVLHVLVNMNSLNSFITADC